MGWNSTGQITAETAAKKRLNLRGGIPSVNVA